MLVRTDTKAFSPFIGRRGPVAMRRAVQHNRGNTSVMCGGNTLDESVVGDEAKTFVVHDHVVAGGPICVCVNAHQIIPAVALMDDGPGDIGPGADALSKDALLVLVVVTQPPVTSRARNGTEGPAPRSTAGARTA